VVEDYAHHPAEVVAALEAVRSAHPRRIWCLFQPHRYSRLNYFARSLASALFPCDHVILTGVYHAFEKPRAGVDSALILAELKNRGHEDARLLEKSKIIDRVFPELREGDVVVVMGAGDIGELADQLVEKIEKESDDGSD
jgi:UDP-N-acetylmuramate--alanine ligase